MNILCIVRRILISKLLFMPFLKGLILVGISFFIWWFLTPLQKEAKKRVFFFTSDVLASALLSAFAFQLLFHFSTILRSPYEWILLSGRSLKWGILVTVAFTGFKKREFVRFENELYRGLLQFLLISGMVNFMYYAVIYGQLVSLLSAGLMGIGLLLLTFVQKKIYALSLLVSFSLPLLQWGLLQDRAFLFFEFILPSRTFFLAALIWMSILISDRYLERRSASSEFN